MHYSSFLSGALIARMGVGCALTGSTLVGYTLVPSWWMMVLLSVMVGLGRVRLMPVLTPNPHEAEQTRVTVQEILAQNTKNQLVRPYVAAHIGEGLMQWLHASYGTVWILLIVHKITRQIHQENAL